MYIKLTTKPKEVYRNYMLNNMYPKIARRNHWLNCHNVACLI